MCPRDLKGCILHGRQPQRGGFRQGASVCSWHPGHPRLHWSRGTCWSCRSRSLQASGVCPSVPGHQRRGVPQSWAPSCRPQGGGKSTTLPAADTGRRPRGAEATRGCRLEPRPPRGSGPLPAAGRGQGADEQDSSAGAYLPPAGPTTRMSFNLHDKVAPLLRADRMPLGQFPKLFKQCNELNVSAG